MSGPRRKRSAQRKPKRRRPLPAAVESRDYNAEFINRLVLAALQVAADLPSGRRPTMRYVGSLAKLCTAAMQFSLNVLDSEGKLVHLPDNAALPN